jgi:hypothetical protein
VKKNMVVELERILRKAEEMVDPGGLQRQKETIEDNPTLVYDTAAGLLQQEVQKKSWVDPDIVRSFRERVSNDPRLSQEDRKLIFDNLEGRG